MNIKKIGVADAHGIESYTNGNVKEKRFGIFVLRASLNRQRHAVPYEIEILEDDDSEIKKLLKENNFVEALKYLKKNFIKVKFPKGYENSWELIPNPKLDPYN